MSDAPSSAARVAGLVLAAGAGRRMGTPKALLRDAAGRPLVALAASRLRAGGCATVTVVLGAAAEEAAALVPPGTEVVRAEDWDEGMAASLRAGLRALAGAGASTRAALVTLVDLPDLTPEVVGRVLGAWRAAGADPGALVRATYGGRPGHPVLLGRDHWAALERSVAGDAGAGPYLARRKVHGVSCEDLATGLDVDRPEDLAR